MKDPQKPIKCACGLTVRAVNWDDHWRTCRFGSGGPASPEDVKALEDSELRLLAIYEDVKRKESK